MQQSTETAREFEVAGKALRCRMCEHTRFYEREARLQTAAAFGFEWASTKATCRICARCGFVHWFVPTHEDSLLQQEESELAAELEALRRSLDDLYDQPVEAVERDEVLT